MLYVVGRTGLELSSLCFVKSGDAFETRDKKESLKKVFICGGSYWT